MFREDTKFASRYEIDVLNRLTGKNFEYDDLIFLEKISGLDYRKRVYLNDTQIGILEFDLVDLDWKFIPSPYYYLLEKPKISLKHTKRRLKGKWLNEDLVENIEEFKELMNGDMDYLGLELGDFVGVGVKKNNRLKVKDLVRKKEIETKKIKDYLAENKKRLETLEKRSLEILEKYVNRYKRRGYVINASFSGGKDSSISTLLAKKVIEDIDVIFIDTGLEYPETLKFVKDFAKEYDLNLHVVKGRDFWSELDSQGIPTKNNRWCNSTCKLIPLKEFLRNEYGDKNILTIDGSRKYESFTRSKLDYERKNGYIDFQTNVFPILDWNAVDVWSYIYSKNMMYNLFYEEGFERIGCYLCPAALNSEFLRVKELHPDLFNKWVNYLKKHYDEEDILRGFWRWDELPPKMEELIEVLDRRGDEN